jgi:uncharacterized protein (TIGR03084 family)
VIGSLSDELWSTPTEATPWTIADQVAHLAFFDHTASLALSDSDEFASSTAELIAVAKQGRDPSMHSLDESPSDLRDRWRRGRIELVDAAQAADRARRIPWYGPAMGWASFVSARLMETWAHGQDIVDALGVSRAPTMRLRHIVEIGVRARPFSYAIRGRDLPAAAVRVVLSMPDGSTIESGPDSATESVNGSAVDFALLVTQRRHRSDLELTATGPVADEWLSIAQAFAGPPGAGRSPRV